MSRDLKIFLGSSIPSGILAGILFSILFGYAVGITWGIFTGLATGTTLYLILGFLHKRLVGRVADNSTDDALSNCHAREIKLQTGFDKAYDLCLSSLDIFNRYNILKADRATGKIVAKTGINWKTWGDIITFDLIRVGADSTLVKISSRPANRTTLVDFGKNLETVQKITSFLEEHGVKD